MSDLGLARYSGFAALPEATALRRQLESDQQHALDNGVHLIVVQSADGTPQENVRMVMITSGTGASTSFAIAEEVIGDLFGSTTADARKIA